MLQVISSKSFNGKKDPNKTYYVCNVMAEDGEIACDVFTDKLYPVGTYLGVKEFIKDHKLLCSVYPIAEKK